MILTDAVTRGSYGHGASPVCTLLAGGLMTIAAKFSIYAFQSLCYFHLPAAFDTYYPISIEADNFIIVLTDSLRDCRTEGRTENSCGT